MNRPRKWQPGNRSIIFASALAVMAGYIVAIWCVGRFFLIRWMPDIELRFALAFLLVQFALILTLFDASFVTKAMRAARETRSMRLRPAMVETLSAHMAAHMASADRMEEIRRMHRRRPRVFERCLVDLLFQVKGAGRKRLSDLAIDLEITKRWMKQRHSRDWFRRREAIRRLAMIPSPDRDRALIEALSDREPSIQLEGARSLIGSGDIGKVAEVFHLAVNGSLLVRAVLAGALRPYAKMLCEEALPAVVQENDPQKIRAALEMAGAWGQSVTIPGIAALVVHADAGVRAAAVQLLAQVENRSRAEYLVIEALQDSDGDVRKAAAVAASHIRAVSAIPALRGCLRQQTPECVLAAAAALACAGPDGVTVLEEEVEANGSFGGAAALEVLERAKAGAFNLTRAS